MNLLMLAQPVWVWGSVLILSHTVDIMLSWDVVISIAHVVKDFSSASVRLKIQSSWDEIVEIPSCHRRMPDDLGKLLGNFSSMLR